ncbi:MAG: MerR family transcriptional regulator [Alphaproteobacteria bacterium]|nr:MerR family transcriptional regulator [Alphaproteobacteria bacterium]
MTDEPFIDAEEAVRRLGVRRATLYAYVSRGMVRAEDDGADPRRRRYSADDIDRLRNGRSRGRSPRRAAAATLDWGLPVLDSGITLIEHGRLFYRGVDAVAYARTATLEDAARLLWGCGEADPFAAAAPGTDDGAIVPAGTGSVARAMALLSLAAVEAGGAWQRDPARRWEDAASLVRRTAAAAAEVAPAAIPVHALLARAWGVPAEAASLLRMALVLSADHELNASTFATRVVASTGAGLAASVVAGMAALSGPRHGGMTMRVQALLAETDAAADPEAALAARLRRGDPLPGFGHPLYPRGDPRAAALLATAGADGGVAGVRRAVEGLTGEAPNIDFALVALARTLALPATAPFVLFLVGRTVGWIAHALEQQATGRLIRPRARYVGPSATPEPAG